MKKKGYVVGVDLAKGKDLSVVRKLVKVSDNWEEFEDEMYKEENAHRKFIIMDDGSVCEEIKEKK